MAVQLDLPIVIPGACLVGILRQGVHPWQFLLHENEIAAFLPFLELLVVVFPQFLPDRHLQRLEGGECLIPELGDDGGRNIADRTFDSRLVAGVGAPRGGGGWVFFGKRT